ncbi:MAG: Flp pilus assembly protein CpaB [Victivallaceae bacterium]|nr:Flp pilus assembly protein CpaB [Victivallaceae bacterium]
MRQKLILLGAVLCGLLAFIITYKQLEAEKQRLLGDTETIALIRMRVNKVEGEELRDTDLERYPVKRQRDRGVTNLEIPWSEVARVVGRRLDTSMAAGQILQSSDLKPLTRKQGFTGIIQDGCRAISIPVSPVTAVSNLIQPNDNVDVIGTFRFPDVRGDSSLDTVTLTILQNVKVLAVGNRWGESRPAPDAVRNYGTVTLLLYPAEVEMLVFASQKGTLTLSLRNCDDSRIDRDIEQRSINFKQLEREIPKYNQTRQRKNGLR